VAESWFNVLGQEAPEWIDISVQILGSHTTARRVRYVLKSCSKRGIEELVKVMLVSGCKSPARMVDVGARRNLLMWIHVDLL
jgi:hypothetical protein